MASGSSENLADTFNQIVHPNIIARHFATKHSWRGKYKRIICITTTQQVVTLDPGDWSTTNAWTFKEDLMEWKPDEKDPNHIELITKKDKKDKKTKSLDFSSDNRNQVLTDMWRYVGGFSVGDEFDASKITRTGDRQEVILRVSPFGIQQLDAVSKRLLAVYYYKDFHSMCSISNEKDAFVIAYGPLERLHAFTSPHYAKVMTLASQLAFKNFRISIPVGTERGSRPPMLLADFRMARLGKGYRESVSVAQFTVTKFSHRSEDGDPNPKPDDRFPAIPPIDMLVPRVLCITQDGWLVEREPATLAPVSAHPLSDVYALYRCTEDLQLFSVEYRDGSMRFYTVSSVSRDVVLASILEGVAGTAVLGSAAATPAYAAAPPFDPKAKAAEGPHYLRNPLFTTSNPALLQGVCTYTVHMPTKVRVLRRTKTNSIWLRSDADLELAYLRTFLEYLNPKSNPLGPTREDFEDFMLAVCRNIPYNGVTDDEKCGKTASLVLEKLLNILRQVDMEHDAEKKRIEAEKERERVEKEKEVKRILEERLARERIILQQQNQQSASDMAGPVSSPTDAPTEPPQPETPASTSPTTESNVTSPKSEGAEIGDGGEAAIGERDDDEIRKGDPSDPASAGLPTRADVPPPIDPLDDIPTEDLNILIPEDLRRARAAITAACLHVIRRLVASKGGFLLTSINTALGARLVDRLWRDLESNYEQVLHMSADIMSVLFNPVFYAAAGTTTTVEERLKEKEQERHNKRLFLRNSESVKKLIQHMTTHSTAGTGSLLVTSIMDLLTYSLCEPYRETTDPEHCKLLLDELAALGRSLFALFHHPCLPVSRGISMLMRAVIENSSKENKQKMQYLALVEGALLRHLYIALYTQVKDKQTLVQRRLSRQLVHIFTIGYPVSMMLLERTLPKAILAHLQSALMAPADEIETSIDKEGTLGVDASSFRPGLRAWSTFGAVSNTSRQTVRKSSVSFGSGSVVTSAHVALQGPWQGVNWPRFFHLFNQDHLLPDLVWNSRTREELRESLDQEIRHLSHEQEHAKPGTLLSWNWKEFSVKYPSITELKVGDYFLRVLMNAGLKDINIGSPKDFFYDLYHRLILDPEVEIQELCLRAMKQTYELYHIEIGHFRETPRFVTFLKRARHNVVLDSLLMLLDILLSNKENASSFIDAGGIKVLSELLALVHLETDRPMTVLETNLIGAGSMEREEEKEWYYTDNAGECAGPLSVKELRDYYKAGTVRPTTMVWAEGLEKYMKIEEVTQLKWSLLNTRSSPPQLSFTQIGNMVLGIFERLCDMFPSRDADGAVICPVPKARRAMAHPNVLPHICQVFLTFQPTLFERTSTVLRKLLEDSGTLGSNAYVTGLFYFALMYTGSNIVPMAQLFKALHLKQACKSEEDVAMVERSILAPMLPPAMVCYLEDYAPEEFSTVFLGEFDNPEAIWNHEMRRMMIEKISHHLGNFALRLRVNTLALYPYCPIAAIQYPQLADELFCHKYYLRHLADTTRFPNWPITGHVTLMQAILHSWKRELEIKGPAMSETEAYESLGLKGQSSYSDAEIRKAYYKLAAIYHPDKNPDGREMFEKISKAYEFLTNAGTGGTAVDARALQQQHIRLIIRAQTIIYDRYQEIMRPFKYAGYPLLLHTLDVSADSDFGTPIRMEMLACASELMCATIRCAPVNSEELTREEGLNILAPLFDRTMSMIGFSTGPQDPQVQITSHLLKSFGLLAPFDICRDAISRLPSVFNDAVRALEFENCPRLREAAMECMDRLSVDDRLQTLFFEAGALCRLVLLLFDYDHTLDSAGVQKDHSSNRQELMNRQAKMSARVLGRLAGYLPAPFTTPENPKVDLALLALMTDFLAKKLNNVMPLDFLHLFTTNSETPYLIWNIGTRVELKEFLEDQLKHKSRTGKYDPAPLYSLVFAAHKNELRVGGVYIRIYNAQPSFEISEPEAFLNKLLAYLGGEAQSVAASRQACDNIKMTLQALKNFLTQYWRLAGQVSSLGRLPLLFWFLRCNMDSALQMQALAIVTALIGNDQCVATIAKGNVLPDLLYLFRTAPDMRVQVLNVLQSLVSHSDICVQIYQRGGLVYLLALFVDSQHESVLRAQAGGVLAKLTADKMHGPRMAILVSKFLPLAFVPILRDSPDLAVRRLDDTCETPELIWNKAMLSELTRTISTMADEFYGKQLADREATFDLPDTFRVQYADLGGKVFVGGVYLHLYLKQPTYQLRNPKEFLTALLDSFVAIASKGSSLEKDDGLQDVTAALVSLLKSNAPLSNQVAATGFINKMFLLLESSQQYVSIMTCLITIVYQLSDVNACVEVMGTIASVQSMQRTAQYNPQLTAITIETLARMLTRNNCKKGCLVEQALRVGLIPYLLSLLENASATKTSLDSPQANELPAIKAHSVAALKSMTTDLGHAEEVNRILGESPVWAAHKDQRHDLFVTEKPSVVGLLMGPGSSTAGLLTDGRK